MLQVIRLDRNFVLSSEIALSEWSREGSEGGILTVAEHPFLDELPLFALGALPPGERRAVEAHLLEGCEACRAELARLENVVGSLPYSLSLIDPPARLKTRLMSAIGTQTSESKRFQRRPTQEFLLAASLLLAAGLGSLWLLSRRDVLALEAENTKLVRTLSTQRRQIEGRLVAQAKDAAWLHDPRVQIALLKGLESSSLARARLVFNPATTQGLLYVDGLPPLPLEKSYELWAFVKDTPVPAGTFETSTGAAVLPLAGRRPG